MESLISIINKLYTTQIPMATQMAEGIEPKVRVFAAIGAFIYIFGRVIVQIANSQDISFFPLLRPFVLMLVIPFAPVICNGLDEFGEEVRAMVNTGNLEIAARVEAMNERIQEKVAKKWETIRTNPEKYQDVFGSTLEEDGSLLGIETDFLINLNVGLEKASESIKFQILAVVQSILLALMYIAESALLLVSIAFRIVLRMGFPIVLALAIFPGFTMALATWFGRYLNFVLLPAVAAMYSRLTFGLVEEYLKYYDVPQALDGMGAELQQPEFLGVAFIALLIMALIGYVQVPSMTSMLVSVGGVGSMVQGTTRAGGGMLGRLNQGQKNFFNRK